MAKRKIGWDEDKIKQFIKEGRGSGEKDGYIPWLKVQDYPSMGMATRIFSKKTNRMHHFFSNTQLQYFYLLEWEDKVIDIREHYPLLDIEEVLKNEPHLSLDKLNKHSHILTTSFLVTLIGKDGNEKYAARTIKYASELPKQITQEKLEIERRYWKEGKGIDWGIVTNKDINIIRAKNIEWIHSVTNGSEYIGIEENETESLLEGLLYRLSNSQSNIKDILRGLEQDYMLDNGTAILLFKYLLANKRVLVNMDNPIDISNSCTTLLFPKA